MITRATFDTNVKPKSCSATGAISHTHKHTQRCHKKQSHLIKNRWLPRPKALLILHRKINCFFVCSQITGGKKSKEPLIKYLMHMELLNLISAPERHWGKRMCQTIISLEIN